MQSPSLPFPEGKYVAQLLLLLSVVKYVSWSNHWDALDAYCDERGFMRIERGKDVPLGVTMDQLKALQTLAETPGSTGTDRCFHYLEKIIREKKIDLK